jgi:hypothetical protein
MLAKVGLITDAERDAIVEGLKSIERDIEAGNFKFDESLEDIHMVIEAELIKRIGEPGRKLHTGRSRNDQVALDLLLWLDESAGNCACASNLDDLIWRAFARCERLARRRDAFVHASAARAADLAGAEALGVGGDVRARFDRLRLVSRTAQMDG